MLGNVDDDHMYRAIQSKDPRFDGWFYTAVISTGIYCRPSCPAITPKRTNVRFYTSAAAAQHARFRACKRCRPDAVPGSPEWNVRSDLAARAMRLISDGVVDREGVKGLADRLGYTERHLHRQLIAEVGASPLAVARAQRAQTARILIETTSTPMAEVAFASGFASVRQFNDTIREVFALTPRELRSSTTNTGPRDVPGAISIRLPYRIPMARTHIFKFLSARAIGGVEEGSDVHYARTLTLTHGSGIVELRADGDAGWLQCHLHLTDLRDLGAAVQRSRRLMDLDADPQAIQEVLVTDRNLKRLVRGIPGMRVPGHVDGPELAVRAILGQQVSVASAKRQAEQLTMKLGKPLTAPHGSLTHHFPASDVLAEARDEDLPMPSTRRNALRALSESLADGRLRLDAGTDRDEATAMLLEIPGLGPWTAAYIRMRALSDPDVFMPSDLGIKHALAALDLPSDPARALAISQKWRPWRSYALQYLWASLEPNLNVQETDPRRKR